MTVDVALLAYICIFLLSKAVLIRRRTALGWSMCIANLTLCVGFGYALLYHLWPGLQNDRALTVVRLMIAAALTWAVVELAKVARDRWALRDAPDQPVG